MIGAEIYYVVGAGNVFLVYVGCKAAGYTLFLFALFYVHTDSD